MLAMQYSIPLPVNFDASRVRERVNARRALFDARAGLLHKSFIYSENDHLYAPFYVWQSAEAARAFLMEDLFKGVVDTFSRHRVRSWIVLGMSQGNKGLRPAYARREIDAIDAGEDLSRYQAREREIQAKMKENQALYLHVSALDADRWEIMRYSLWAEKSSAPKPLADCLQEYEVLHVSEPSA